VVTSSTQGAAGAQPARAAAASRGGGEPFTFASIVGTSKPLRAAIDTARMFASARLSTVLLVGETGTGKELFARGIHCEGPNAAAPFVAVNCAAIPESLLESELFGHEAGAFTGAVSRKHGLMELAGCGTLFLDEMHHLPAQLQPKLLRALEERRIRRLSGSHEISIECRIIAATNVAIEDAVEDGYFREDLFYRLNVLRVDIPPLRDRTEDIEALARHFLGEIARTHGMPAKRLAKDAGRTLLTHGWPGNVRELRNVIERAIMLSGGEPEVRPAHLVIQQRSTRSGGAREQAPRVIGEIAITEEGKSLAAIEREATMLTLQLTKGNRSQAARLLGISRPTLARILKDCAPQLEVDDSIEAAS
jgi:transcriptional regulator with PAS, ATPase and Fis domain